MDWHHWLDIISIILMGLVEGVTEFLPISSSAHLILLNDILGFKGPPGKVFEVVIQFGAILAISFLYFKDLWAIAESLPRKNDQGREARLFTLSILLAFIPSAILGVIFHKTIKDVFFNPLIVCIPMIIGGIAILLIEHFYKPRENSRILSLPLAVKIGICQCMALIPGVSRSGATILGGMLLGLSRSDATRFSFFVAIPTMLGAATFDLYKNWADLTYNNLYEIGLGLFVAFITALFAVKWLVNFVRRHNFIMFGWYRIIVGSVMLVFFLSMK